MPALPPTAPETLAQALADAQAGDRLLTEWPAAALPEDAEQAYAIQYQTLTQLGQPIAGWKIGAKSPDGPIQAAPLPGRRVLASPARLARADFAVLGLELEIAFRLGRRLGPRSGGYAAHEVLRHVSETLATIELVSSRLPGWPDVPKLAQLADLQNHGALVIGASVPWQHDFAPEALPVSFRFNGQSLAPSPGRNPAGDLGRLLVWLVNHVTARGLTVERGQVLTTGSFTGMAFPAEAGVAVGEIAGLPPVTLTLI